MLCLCHLEISLIVSSHCKATLYSNSLISYIASLSPQRHTKDMLLTRRPKQSRKNTLKAMSICNVKSLQKFWQDSIGLFERKRNQKKLSVFEFLLYRMFNVFLQRPGFRNHISVFQLFTRYEQAFQINSFSQSFIQSLYSPLQVICEN